MKIGEANEAMLLDKIYAAKKGDTNAFGEVYSELYAPLFRFVSFRVQDKDTAEDFVSQTFLKWFESLQNYEPKIKPINYLYTIATRLMINEGVRKKSQSLPEDAEEFIPDESLDIESILNIQVDFERIKKIIVEELNEIEQSVIQLKYIEEKDNKEIAEILDKQENNVRQIEHRAFKKIKAVLAENRSNP